MTSPNRNAPLHFPPPADPRWPNGGETEHRLAENIGESERTAFSEWLRHVEVGRIGPHLGGDAK